MPPINPYGHSTTILDPTQFFGRTDALNDLYSEILAKRCISVVGTRRVGKSSLLRCMCLPEVQQRFESHDKLKKHVLVFIDLGEFLSKTCDDFFKAVGTQLVSQSKGRFALEMPQEASSGDTFCELLDQIQLQGFHPVLLLDAFHKVTYNMHFDPQFFSFMRAQANHGRVTYITASITTLDKCCHPYIEGSPFFNIFHVYRLGPLAEDEARQLVTDPALSVECPFSDEEVQELLRLAGRHPFFIQQLAFSLFKAKYHEPARPIKYKQKAYEYLIPHFKDIWECSLDAEQREHLREEARWRYVRHRKHPELGESVLFRKFVRDICDIKPLDITVECLEEVLKHFGDTRFLAESDLTHLYLFSAHAQNSKVPRSYNEKGSLVRKILKDARDKLRPSSDQKDTAPEWLYFNILNNCYFHRCMKNQPLADLLGISLRQVDRKRDLAIEALLESLNAMEITAREELEL